MFVLPLLALVLFQSAPAAQPAAPPPEQQQPHGKVLFERHEEPVPETAPSGPALHSRNAPAEPSLPDALRDSFAVTAYDLDMHLNYATGDATIRARISVRNTGAEAVTHIPLQVSSSMHWQSARMRSGTSSVAIPYEEHALSTDTDHTGRASELWLKPSTPLAAGASIHLDLFYEGPLVENAARLLAVGAPEAQASSSDWDGFNSAQPASGVRGFGNVLWYPVIHRALHLGKGNELFSAIADQRIAVENIPFHLRLTVESPTPLTDAFLCGERQPLQPLTLESSSSSPDEKLPISGAPVVSTAEWHLAHIGQRAPNLFIASVKASTATSNLLEAYTERPATLASYNAAAVAVRPVMEAWLGARPLTKLTLLDLGGRGALPFQDGTMIVLPMRIEDQDRFAPTMAEWLTSAWFHGSETWMNSGLAVFMQRVWAERELRGDDKHIITGKGTALALAIYESARTSDDATTSSSSSIGTERPPLTRCADPICYRTKGAAIFRMLRYIVGEEPLQAALQAFRNTGGDAQQFQAVLERTSGKDLGWFFDDWVYHDRGLPDLSIIGVSPRTVSGTTSNIAGTGAGTTSPAGQRTRALGGWLVAVEVQNDGDATAEVPVTLRGDQFSTTERLRILPHSQATTRILVPAEPHELQVNDGTVPELRADTHIRTLQVKQQQ